MLKSPAEITLLILLIVTITYIATKNHLGQERAPIVVAMPSANQLYSSNDYSGAKDDRYRRAPRPQRMWDNGPEIPVRGALDPVPTRGAPESYQQMGVITSGDGKVLPLYGRRVAPRSDFFNYYTRTDTYNPVALPVSFKKRDCQDNVGCAELMNQDTIKLAATGEDAKVTLYGFDGPRYVPDI
jgi:hypothetical protein